MKKVVLSERQQFIGNILAFQATWATCVLGGSVAALLLLPALAAWHSLLLKRHEWRLILVFVGVGVVLDTVLMHGQWLRFDHHTSPLIPLWLMVLWVGFATTLRHSLLGLWSRPWLVVALGLIGAPWSYWAGSRLGALSIDGAGLWLIAGAWAVLMLAMAGYWRWQHTRGVTW